MTRIASRGTAGSHSDSASCFHFGRVLELGNELHNLLDGRHLRNSGFLYMDVHALLEGGWFHKGGLRGKTRNRWCRCRHGLLIKSVS